MKLLLGAYKDASYEVSIKAGFNFFLQLFIIVMLIPLTLLVFNQGETVIGFTILVMDVFFMVTLFLLRKGKYDLSSYMFSIALFVLILAERFSGGYHGANTFTQTALMFLIVSQVAAFQIRNKKHVQITVAAALFSYIVFCAFIIITAAYKVDPKPLSGQLVTGTVLMLIGLALVTVQKIVFNMVTEDSMNKYKESEVHSSRMISLISSVSDQIDQALGLRESAEETGMAVVLIENRVNGIMKSIKNLNNGFTSTKIALDAIGGSVEELKNNAQNQSANVTESSAAIEEMVASIKSVSTTIQVRKKSVESLIHTSKNGEEVIKQTESSFNEVIDQISSIRDMTSLISSIAAQTNLLAMNAAIEAAHAGDAGRGFAVVADEIRKLAESSSGNAKKISENLKTMIASIENTGAQVKQSGHSFEEIREEVDTVARAMDDIYNSTEELNTGSEEILRSTTSLNELTSNVMDSVNEVDEDKRTIDSNLGNNQQLSSDLEQVAHEIKKDADEIKLSSDKVLTMANSLAEQSEILKKEF
ncbi:MULTISPECIES: methyl-accepting chemotaxis protein [unclassified Oceanispirochaeta]|uniref:methyl-accepting chemotaxis protein n=1 Tax=unclassified Oceanispirochaeta TaxID=2635722 RepID=UPI000E0945CE|nr:MULTISPECIES: methyl-accepting chemotaxis protein [unclassified Oceanispirochaeta]MBF9014967.1 hypothetical protein [Oceanispirochaeta sp. M2]NPD71352.1 hypothetical protein [Oceanispirochaeta sp. M1]RDG33317.1 hypothetical protein DV872_04485 [Oceanispirochaeta sp. M1]